MYTIHVAIAVRCPGQRLDPSIDPWIYGLFWRTRLNTIAIAVPLIRPHFPLCLEHLSLASCLRFRAIGNHFPHPILPSHTIGLMFRWEIAAQIDELGMPSNERLVTFRLSEASFELPFQ